MWCVINLPDGSILRQCTGTETTWYNISEMDVLTEHIAQSSMDNEIPHEPPELE